MVLLFQFSGTESIAKAVNTQTYKLELLSTNTFHNADELSNLAGPDQTCFTCVKLSNLGLLTVISNVPTIWIIAVVVCFSWMPLSMPTESQKSSPIITPTRLKSPSKSKPIKDVGPIPVIQEDKRFVTQLIDGSLPIEDQSTPRQLEDIELQEKESTVRMHLQLLSYLTVLEYYPICYTRI